MFMGDRKIIQKITPMLMFVGKQCGKAEEAINFYASVFYSARVGDIARYGKGQEPDKEGTVAHAAFTLEGQEFAAIDTAPAHPFTFNEAISFMVHCDTQADIDYYWKSSLRIQRPNTVAGSKTGTASRGRSYPPLWMQCSEKRTRRKSRE
jgi:predicted 3-demethylubiquinone-9 3-methyltransferase (glyoxalase superfamily)